MKFIIFAARTMCAVLPRSNIPARFDPALFIFSLSGYFLFASVAHNLNSPSPQSWPLLQQILVYGVVSFFALKPGYFAACMASSMLWDLLLVLTGVTWAPTAYLVLAVYAARSFLDDRVLN